jgi:hypothetical protein
VHQRTWWLLREATLGLVVLGAALWIFGGAAGRVEFHGDEGASITTSRYFEYFFVRPDFDRREWRDNYSTHTQPMITRYLIGGWLRAGGYDLEKLPGGYVWDRSLEENRRLGRVPDDALLARARAPMVLCAAGAAVLLYALGRVLAGALAGLVAATLALASPLAQEYLVRARPDAPVAFFSLLALLLAVLGSRRGRLGGLPLGWAVAVGVALGLALGTKLTAVLSLAATLAWGILAVAVSGARYRAPGGTSPRPAPDTRHRAADAGTPTSLGDPRSALVSASSAPDTGWARAWVAGRGWALALVVAVAVFVASDPHLYRDPLLHTGHLFRFRMAEGEVGQRARPQAAVRDPLDRVAFVLRGSLVDGTVSGARGVPLEAVLATAGAAALLVGAWRSWRRAGLAPPEGLILLTALAYYAGTSAFLYLAWDRYLVPTLLIGTLFSGLGVAAMLRQVVSARAASARVAGRLAGRSSLRRAEG